MIFNYDELFQIIVMSVAVGYIFMNSFKRFSEYDPLNIGGFDWNSLKLSIIVTSPAIILHELGHKFAAMAFGLNAIFHAAYGFLTFGIVLKLIGAPFIFFVPAYVSISGVAKPYAYPIVALAGPFLNLVIFLIAKKMLENNKLTDKKKMLWYFAKQINFFLFLFNLLPIPGFDGFQAYYAIFKMIF